MWKASDIFARRTPLTDPKEVGQKGEAVAADYLQSLGYRVEQRNVMLGHDEIDLIALDPVDEVLVFAEVKTRSRFSSTYPPALAADKRKRERLRRSARRWIDEHAFDGGYRIDLISVANGRVVDHVREIAWA